MGNKTKQSKVINKKDERIVADAFEYAINVVKRTTGHSNATKIYDLVGPILKRRKQATLSYMETVRERYSARYPELAVEEEWARQNCAMGHSVDGADHLYHISLAAAIWMLDALSQSRKMLDVYPYFTTDDGALAFVDIPEIHDPCHDESVIRGMIDLIQQRDKRDNPYQWYINNVSALRHGSTETTVPSATMDVCDMTKRQRFDAVMAMIHPTLKERAVQRFEEKIWEFLDGYFHCAAKYAKEQTEYEQKALRISEQCERLYGKIKDEERTRNQSVLRTGPFAVKPTPTMPSFGADVFSYGSGSDLNAGDDADALYELTKQGMAYEAIIEEIENKRTALMLSAHMAPMTKIEELRDMLDADVLERVLAFTVDDPYETCFAYLCLIESGSDLPWLYNASMAVLLAAARKLPWTAFDEDPESLYDDEDEWEDVEEEIDESVEVRNAGTVTAPIDWNHKKKTLYELKYLDTPLYAPLESPTAGRKVNLPQLVFGMTGGMIMPRRVSDYDGVSPDLVAAGMKPDEGKVMELYLQLAFDHQFPSRDWDALIDAEVMMRIEQLDEKADVLAEAAPEADVDELRAQLQRLKGQNDELRRALYAASKEAEREKQEASRILKETENEHQELLDLRELVFNQANDAEQVEICDAEDIAFPHLTEKRLVVFGGHDTWLKAIRPMLPNTVFVGREQNPSVDIIRGADTVWIQANALSHKHYYKIINVARTNRIPVRYFSYASARKCAEQLVRESLTL